MSNKLKITLGVLVLLAGFLVTRIGLTIKKSAETASRVRGESTIAPEENSLLKDSDNDGIADYDEAYYRTDPFKPDTDDDGYLDGEEVVGGFNPSQKDEQKRPEGNNVTLSLTDRFVAGVFAGDLNPRNGHGEKYGQGINALTFAAIDEALTELLPPPNSTAIIFSNDSQEAQQKYLQDTVAVLEGPFLSSFMAQPQTLNQVVNLMVVGRFEEAAVILQELSTTFTAAYAKLLTIEVPPKWTDFHGHLLSTFRQLSTNYAAVAKLEQDPVLALMGLNNFALTLSQFDFSIIQELKTLIAKEGLTVPESNLFEIIGLLNNV